MALTDSKVAVARYDCGHCIFSHGLRIGGAGSIDADISSTGLHAGAMSLS